MNSGGSERSSRRLLQIVLVMTFLEQMSTTALRPMVSFYVLELTESVVMLSIVVFAYAAAALLTSWWGGALVNWAGPRAVTITGATLTFTACVVLVVAPGFWLVAASQVILACGQALIVLSGQAMLARYHAGPDRGYGLYAAVASSGQVFGPLAATGIVSLVAGSATSGPDFDAALHMVFWCTLGALAALFAATLTLPRVPYVRVALDGAPRPSFRRVLGMPRLPGAIIASGLIAMSLDLVVAYLPALAFEFGWSVVFVGLLLSLRAGAGILSRLLMNTLIRAGGRRLILTLSMCLPGLCVVALPALAMWASGQSWTQVGIAITVVVFGFWNGVGVPVTMHWVATAVPATYQASALGLRLTANRLGQTIVPVALGALGATVSVASIFIAIGVVLIVATTGLQRAFRSLE